MSHTSQTGDEFDSAKALQYVKDRSPHFNHSEALPSSSPNVTIQFYGSPSTSTMNMVMTFQYELYRRLKINSRIEDIRQGCVEVDFSMFNLDIADFANKCADGFLDRLAYMFRITSISFPDQDDLRTIEFERDSIFVTR